MRTYSAGIVTAYGSAKAGGYTGTYAEFCEALGDLANVLEDLEGLTVVANTLPEGSSATASYSDGVLTLGIPKGDKGDKGDRGETGNGIASIVKTSTSGLVDTYTITYTDGNTETFTVTNGEKGEKGDTGETGNGIASITKTATIGKVDTYTITYTDGTTTTFDVTNGEVTEAQFNPVKAELENIRVGADGTTYSTAGNAVRGQIGEISGELTDVEDWLGYPHNLIDARDFTTTHTSNWEIVSATKTSVTINHKTTYSTGFPTIKLDLPSGDYVFNADYSDTSLPLSLRVNGSWVKSLTNGTEFTVDSADNNEIYFSSSVVATYTITDMSIVAKEPSGKIPTIEDDIDQLSASVGVMDVEITDLQNGFADISEPVISELTGEETEDKTINASGAIITAGGVKYKVAKYPVNAGKTYWLTASANWSNLLWCFYDNNDAVIQTGTASASGSTFTSITDEEVTAPNGATYIRITYNTTVASGKCKTQTGFSLAKKWVGKKWVCVGDSLTAENIRTTKHYFDYVAEETGITTVNMGDSGSGYAREQDVGTAFYQRIGDCPTDADVVTIFGSFNDLGAGLPIGSVDDTGTDTLAGCINTTIDNLQSVIPLVNLGIVAPTPWDTTQPSTSGQAYNYVEMLKAICARRSIPFLDLWHCSNLRPWDADFRALAYSKDGGSGTHPDETGHKIIAPRFKAFLETLLL